MQEQLMHGLVVFLGAFLGTFIARMIDSKNNNKKL